MHTATASTARSHLPSVLIVEDEIGPRDSLKMILNPSFNTYAVDNADTAIQVLNAQHIDLVTLDLKLPGRHGMDLLRQMQQDRHEAAVIIITGYGTLSSAMEGIRNGVAAYLTKPFDVGDVMNTVNNTLEKKHSLDRLRNTLRNFGNLWEHEKDIPATLTRLSSLIEAKDAGLSRHCRRTQFYASQLADQLSLDDAARETLDYGAYLHDLGMLGNDDQIFTNFAALDETAWDPERLHTEIGARMGASLGFSLEVCEILRHHHERYDGSGYPDGLKGEEIPLLARIVSIAQAFDHLVSGNPKQPPLSRIDATNALLTHAGTHFDPKLIELFTPAAR